MSNNTNTTAPPPKTTTPKPNPPPTTSKPTSTTTASSAAKTHTIKVGPKEAPHEYIPHEVDAKVGDLIVFQFHPRNHSVVQADWRAPCVPADGDYFFSGIKNDFNEVNGQVSGMLPTWNWTVPRPEPIFFYCTAIDSCKENGMVGVINPTTQKSYESQRKAALDAPYMLIPGQSMPAEGDYGSTTTDNPSEAPSNAHAASSHSLGGGAIAGIVIGAVAFVAVLCALIYLFARNQAYRKFFSHSHEGASTSDGRTAQWALSASAATAGAGAGAGAGKSDVDTTSSTGVPRNMSTSVRGASPVSDPGVFGPGPMAGPVFAPMDQNLAQTQSGIYPHPEGGYGVPSPLGSQRQHSPQLQPGQQQQQQPYWIWDQTVQPRHLGGRTGGPTELEGETPK